jgi:hypothetical protein
MSFTLTDLTAIQTAIARGELEVEFADRRVRYRSMTELLQAEARITEALTSSSLPIRPKQTIGVAGKGFTC